MGNRAHVIFEADGRISPAIYLHWNGGPESVYPFLDELDRRRVRGDTNYSAARFAHIVGDFFDQDKVDAYSLGICNGPKEITPEALRPYDHGDNGVYVVSRDNGKRKVRRFRRVLQTPDVAGRGVYEMREASTEAVERERQEAYKHAYNRRDVLLPGQEQEVDTIAETFERLRPKIED